MREDLTTSTYETEERASSEPEDCRHSVSMLLHAEKVAVGKRRVEELVSVKRATKTKSVSVEEPVTSEYVTVEHVHVGHFVDAVPPVREEGETIILSIVEEVAVVVKRLFLKEELRITKTRVTSHHVETVTVREQHARVTRTPMAAGAAAQRLPPKSTNPMRSNDMEDFETIVAVYDTPAHAELAVGDLRQAKVPESAISRYKGSTTTTETAPVRERGFWASLFGGDTHDDEHIYERSARSGSSIVVVRTPLRDVDAVMDILERHNPVNIDERAESYGASAGTMTAAAASTAAPGSDRSAAAAGSPPAVPSYADGSVAAGTTGEALHLSEEQLVVGKRLVNRGGTRLRRYVVETPVQEDVSLHSETIKVERRPVTGDAGTEPDFSEKTIEMTASAEEAVIGKTAHVAEEVSLRKEASDRVETVRDTVRKEEVEVEQIPGENAAEVANVKTGAPPDPRAPRI
jgi:uncharacterized protein (TIGR02271 family)